MASKIKQLSGDVAYSAPSYWMLKHNRGGAYIGFNVDVVKYPLLFLSLGVIVFGFVAWQNEQVRNLLSLSQWLLVLLVLFFVPSTMLLILYLVHWRGPRWLIFKEDEPVLKLPRRAMTIPVQDIVAIQSLSGYYGFAKGYQRKWVSELRVIYREENCECVVSVVGTTVPEITDDAAEKLAQVLHTEAMIQEVEV